MSYDHRKYWDLPMLSMYIENDSSPITSNKWNKYNTINAINVITLKKKIKCKG